MTGRLAITVQTVTVALTRNGDIEHARIWCIDADHANAKRPWQTMCARNCQTPSDIVTLHLVWWPQDVNIAQGRATVQVMPQPVTAVEILGAGHPC